MSGGRAVVIGSSPFVVEIIASTLTKAGLEIAPDEPDVVVLTDVAAGTWQEARELGAPRVVLLGDKADDEALFVEAVASGAEAVVSADADVETVVSTVRAVAAGETVLSPRQAGVLARHLRDGGARREAAPEFIPTRRERDILESIDRGESVKQTARTLGISIKTVENLQSRLFRKLDVRNRAQAVARAHALGVLDATD